MNKKNPANAQQHSSSLSATTYGEIFLYEFYIHYKITLKFQCQARKNVEKI